eukprot:CAMPEP_0180212264 /NCGR_PEP_ID=MMETSP0987-20121128/13376_1 /TAXON_ID=697907 /ORGANISM="non described non described, Strain CCMP2293" /LENGTH=130 /DNA_ID=CAMNT_0022169857 /DNA_START=81 /DNA_END=474 /DNA_ORIENTATION=-
MFALILQVESLAGGPRYGTWAPPGFLSDPSKGWHSDVESGFTECPSRAASSRGSSPTTGGLLGSCRTAGQMGCAATQSGSPRQQARSERRSGRAQANRPGVSCRAAGGGPCSRPIYPSSGECVQIDPLRS